MNKKDWAYPHITVTSNNPYGKILACPYCEGENLHIIEAQIHRGRDIITISGDKINVDEFENTSRGTYINIKFVGECRHLGRIILHFHKGYTFIYNERMGEITEKERERPFNDIFRD